MKQLLIELEESNIRWAQIARQHAKTNIKWLWVQSIVFGAFGLWFLSIPFFGGSWWYLFSSAMYAGLIVFFWRYAYPRHVAAIWSANRVMAKGRIRLKRLIEE
jgi:hypothetical protein